jgi:coenzyme F420 hydrogenase subunit beta
MNCVTDIVKHQFCVGCGICESIAGSEHIVMRETLEGFLRPSVVGDPQMKWGAIKASCPGITLKPSANGSKKGVWGHVEEFMTGHASDPEVRWNASSGGIITALLCWLLSSKKVDAVIQVGRAKNNALRNQVYVNQTEAEVRVCSGSRYSPSSPLREILQILRRDDRVFAYVGKPCDAAALSQALRLYPELKAKVAYIVSFACAGVPSQRATEELVAMMGLGPNEVREFWYRGRGWPGKATAVAKSGKIESRSYDESWNNFLGPQVPFRCKICPDSMGDFADVVCADAWHTKNGRPIFDEQPGRSYIIVRTSKGKELIRGAREAKFITVEAADISELAVAQPYQYRRKVYFLAKYLALKLFGRTSTPDLACYARLYVRHEGLRCIKRFWVEFSRTVRKLKSMRAETRVEVRK